jgi:O-glycosyl hydrolase
MAGGTTGVAAQRFAPSTVMRCLTVALLVSISFGQTVQLPFWTAPATSGDTFEFTGGPPVNVRYSVPGFPRRYFPELLPALFERTLAIDSFEGSRSRLAWIFTGPAGGFTIEVEPARARLIQRQYDSLAFGKGPARHPERVTEESTVQYAGPLRAVTVRVDHRLNVSVLLNGKEVLRQNFLLDVNRHQLAFAGVDGGARGRLLPVVAEPVQVTVDSSVRCQRMLGFGGITTPAAYAQLSEEGKRLWWRKVVEYNLLLQREYPMGARLNREMTNWDRLQDASPHSYGDNFPNGEISDFKYIRALRRVGGKVIFEFWELPGWAKRDWRDGNGRLYPGVADINSYVKAVLSYCRLSREKAGAPPDIVGIQNEVIQPGPIWQQMTLALRKALDEAGFVAVQLHMPNNSRLATAIDSAKAFTANPEVWKAIDYAASNMYDYQESFFDPENFDGVLRRFKQLIAPKPFLAIELCVNDNKFQARSYRIALAMAQLYHKNLTLLDSVALVYCWSLLNAEQPSYGWTRTLMVPDAEHGFVPVAPSHQLRVLGAYSRRVREGMTRVEAASSTGNLLVTAFEGADGARTLVLLNRGLRPQSVKISWPGKPFRYMETVSPQAENIVRPAPSGQVTVDAGSLVTISNVELGGLADDPTR